MPTRRAWRSVGKPAGEVVQGALAEGRAIGAGEEDVACAFVEDLGGAEASGEGGLLVGQNVVAGGEEAGWREGARRLLQGGGGAALGGVRAVGVHEAVQEARGEGPAAPEAGVGVGGAVGQEGGDGVDEGHLLRLGGGQGAEGQLGAGGVAAEVGGSVPGGVEPEGGAPGVDFGAAPFGGERVVGQEDAQAGGGGEVAPPADGVVAEGDAPAAAVEPDEGAARSGGGVDDEALAVVERFFCLEGVHGSAAVSEVRRAIFRRLPAVLPVRAASGDSGEFVGLEGEAPRGGWIGGIQFAEKFQGLAPLELAAAFAGGEVALFGGEGVAHGFAPGAGGCFGDDEAEFAGAAEGEGGVGFGGGGDVVQGVAKGGGRFEGGVGFEGEPVPTGFEGLGEGEEAGLEEGFAAGQDDIGQAEVCDASGQVREVEAQAGREVGVAPRAGEVAAGEADEDAGAPGVAAFALPRSEEFVERIMHGHIVAQLGMV